MKLEPSFIDAKSYKYKSITLRNWNQIDVKIFC